MMKDFVDEYQTHVYTTLFGNPIIVWETMCDVCICRGWTFEFTFGILWRFFIDKLRGDYHLREDYQADQKLLGLLWSVICFGFFFFLGLTVNVSLLSFKVCLYQITFLAKWNIFSFMSGQSLITVYLKYPKWNALRVLLCSHFDRNNILFPEINVL